MSMYTTNTTTKTISSIIITVFVITTMSSSNSLLFIPFSQIEQIIQNRNVYSDNDYYYHIAFAYHGKEISQKLNYAHFLPLTSNNNKTHQVQVVVNYSVTDDSIINQNMNAIMHVYTPNGTLIKSSSFPHGFVINATKGQSKLATSITDNTIMNVKADVIFTDAAKDANYSNPLSVNLTLGQKIPPIKDMRTTTATAPSTPPKPVSPLSPEPCVNICSRFSPPVS